MISYSDFKAQPSAQPATEAASSVMQFDEDLSLLDINENLSPQLLVSETLRLAIFFDDGRTPIDQDFKNLLKQIAYVFEKETLLPENLLQASFKLQEAIWKHFLKIKEPKWLFYLMEYSTILSSETRKLWIDFIKTPIEDFKSEISQYGSLFFREKIYDEENINILQIDALKKIAKKLFATGEDNWIHFIFQFKFYPATQKTLVSILIDTFIDTLKHAHKIALYNLFDKFLVYFLPAIKQGNVHKSEKLYFKLYKMLTMLPKDEKYIVLCKKHNLSLVNNELKEEQNESDLHLMRMIAHKIIFKRLPRTIQDLPFHPNDQKHPHSPKPIQSLKLRVIIAQLARKNAVVSNIIFHWTDWINFTNIIRSGKMYGNNFLQRKKLLFQKNALDYTDVENGDGNVICFSPYLVDHLALLTPTLQKLREGLIRIAIDIRQVKTQRYQRFFKLSDFAAPDYQDNHSRLTDRLTLIVLRPDPTKHQYTKQDSPVLILKIIFDQKEYTVFLKKEECIFYGEHEEINLFCLLQLLYAAQRHPELDQQLISYLESLDINTLRKVLTKAAKSLLIFAEYNFNAQLPLAPLLIQEVYLAEHNKIISLGHLSVPAYQARLQQLITLDDKTVIDEAEERQSSPHVTFDNCSMTLYGNLFPSSFEKRIILTTTSFVEPQNPCFIK